MPLYFAYGSNLNFDQMTDPDRCPSAEFVCVAELPDHKLDFTRLSVCRGCGVADAVRADGHRVCGVVYDISEEDLANLDKREGYRPDRPRYRNSYVREKCQVTALDGEARTRTVWTYFAIPQENPPLPNREYKDLIVSGANHWELPADYIAELERIETSE